jgi:hypothetical protein
MGQTNSLIEVTRLGKPSKSLLSGPTVLAAKGGSPSDPPSPVLVNHSVPV